MFNPSIYDDEIAFGKCLGSIAKLHAKAAAKHEKELIFLGMRMPNELALKLHDFDVLTVQLAHNARVPVIGEARQLVS